MNATTKTVLDSVPFTEDHNGEPLSVHNTVRRYHDSLINFLRQRLRTPEDAFDVAQEAYIRMMQYQNSREIRSPSSMLFRIAINVANDLGRSEQVRHVADQCRIEDLELASDMPSPEREVSARQELALLRAAAARDEEIFTLGDVEVSADPRRLLPNEPSISAFGFDKPLLETPRSVSAVSSETIDLFGLSAVEDLVRLVPGTFTTTRFGIQGSVDVRNVPADFYFRGMKRLSLQGHGRSVLGALDTMTTLATVLGILPIALAFGAGAESRMSMGIAVIGGLVCGGALTLFVIPAMYVLMHRRRVPIPGSAPVPYLTR